MNPPISTSLRGARILVAEEIDGRQLVAQQAQEALAIDCDVAVSGSEAVRLALDPGWQYDLLLLDLQMADMDGLAVAAEIRRQHGPDRLPIIAVTAHFTELERDLCLAGGFNEYLVKPIDQATLTQVLARWIGPPAAADAADTNALPQSLPGYAELGAALARVNGNTALLKKLIVSFHDKFLGFSDAWRAAPASGNQAAALHLTHSLKGLAGTVGADALARAAAALERAMSESRAAELPELLAAVETQLTLALDSAASLRDSAQTGAAPLRPPPAGQAPEHIEQLFFELRALLDNNNLRACECLVALNASLSGRGMDRDLVELGGAIERLDYRAAECILEKILIIFSRK